MYFDEEIVLDARLNCLNPHVDYFIIIESCFTHRGDRRELNFDINKYKKIETEYLRSAKAALESPIGYLG